MAIYSGFYVGLMGFYGGLMGSNGISDWIYPLVNVYKKTMDRSTIFNGKFTNPETPKKNHGKIIGNLVILPANPLPDSGV